MPAGKLRKNYDFFLASWSHRRKELDPELDPDPDPLVRGTDPGIRIRNKMSRISNTGSNTTLWSYPSPPLDGRDALSRGSRPSAAQSLDQRDAHCNVITKITSESYKGLIQVKGIASTRWIFF
jgi:hypothetical protein